tara:strand:- start:7625 stop:8083 length:459 start_codon:yes stop_codon:yes gene_type:complete
MSNGHEQIDKLILNNNLKDFLIEAMQDETFAVGSADATRYKDAVSRHQLRQPPRNPYAHLQRQQSMNIDKILDKYTRPGIKATPNPKMPMPGFGALGAVAFLAPAIQELLYGAMGLDASGLEDEAPWFPEGSTYETAFPPGPSTIEPIKRNR